MVIRSLAFINNFGKFKPDWLICFFNVLGISTLVLGASVFVAAKSLSFLSDPKNEQICRSYYK